MAQNDITSKQNEQTSIDRLAAQRNLYTHSKAISHLLFVASVLVPVILAILKVVITSCPLIPKIIVVYSFMATLSRIWLKDMTDKRKLMAAKIQQLFDCDLFGLAWNEALCGTKPKPEDVFNARKGKIDKNLNNWYESIVSKLPLSLGALVCMRTNVAYDQSLRKQYSVLCYIITFIAVAIVCSLGMINNTGMWDAFLYGIIPLMPLITWGIDLHKQHCANLKALNNIETLIETSLNQAKEGHQPSQRTLEEIQNFIFLHRKTSYLIPNMFYKIARRKNETAAFYGANEICKTYNLFKIK